MLACVDVDYRDDASVAACVAIASWEADTAVFEVVHETGLADDYEPGQFYRRELPSLLGLLAQLPQQPAVIVIDGYVWLDGGRKGLGAHLFDALGGKVAVVGVAKNPFRSATDAREVKRGESERPLYVTAAGMAVDDAAAGVARMAGPYRLPSMLKRADRLCRDAG